MASFRDNVECVSEFKCVVNKGDVWVSQLPKFVQLPGGIPSYLFVCTYWFEYLCRQFITPHIGARKDDSKKTLSKPLAKSVRISCSCAGDYLSLSRIDYLLEGCGHSSRLLRIRSSL